MLRRRPASQPHGSLEGRLSLVLSIVFGAIIAAALALATYGYRYARNASERATVSLTEGNRQIAQALINNVQDRIDTLDLELFRAVEWTDISPPLPETLPLPRGVQSVVVLDRHLRIRALYPPPDPKKKAREWERWQGQVRGLEWSSLQPWTPSAAGNFRHLHQLFDGRSVLIAYAAKESLAGEPYYVAARLDLGLITDAWIPSEIQDLASDRRIVVLDEMARPIVGQVFGARDARFVYEASFGKTLYAWRVQMLPRNVEDLQAQAKTERLLGVLLVPLATAIIAVGLAIVYLVVAAERRASRLKSDFIANVSHELKTPLSLIRMFGELLSTGKHKDAASARDYAEIITREADRLSHLIDNVLDFARLERGKASYHFAEGAVADVVARVLDVTRYRLEKERIRLVTEIEPGLPLVRMDENALTLVLLNLIDNAVKHGVTPGVGGEIKVVLARNPGGVALSVKDQGPGIPPDEQAAIFERFYRARGARDRNVRGSGIGLALAKAIAEAHGGRVVVESVQGQGATFTVVLPAAPILTPLPITTEEAEHAAAQAADQARMGRAAARAAQARGSEARGAGSS